MKPATLYLCADCKRTLKRSLTVKELKADSYKDKCAICGRLVYGSWYDITDKEDKAS